ncbi:MAG: D-alanyl-D-alanine endopeptidase [Deltaproteobacteria bacterium]
MIWLIVITFLVSSLPIGFLPSEADQRCFAATQKFQNVHDRAKKQQTQKKKKVSQKSTRKTLAQKKKISSYKKTTKRKTAVRIKTAGKAPRRTLPVAQKTKGLHLASRSVLVFDEASDRVILSKNEDQKKSIASITKLMTAMVVLDAGLPLDERITITEDDIDTVKHSSSRLAVGATLTRSELLRLALMSSENRAASALARTYPGGTRAFVAAMNAKAKSLGMHNTRFVDSTGLRSSNVSTASDLVRMVQAAYTYPLIRIYSTTDVCEVPVCGRILHYKNTNALVREGKWDINISKTGYIREAGSCLVMRAKIEDRPMVIVLLDSQGKNSRIQDARAIESWIKSEKPGLVSGKNAKGTGPDAQG